MPVKSLFWPDNSDEDIHLIPGYTGPRLDHLLWISQTVGAAVRADSPPAGVTVSFAANFPAGPRTAGVTVSANGEVTVGNVLAAPPRLLDFLVVATVTEAGNPASPFTAYRRFHIHEGIRRMWLSPSELTVREGADGMRFAVLAEFTDGTYGNLLTWCPWDPFVAGTDTYVRETGAAVPAISWTSNAAARIDVDPWTGELEGNVAAGSATISAAVAPLPSPPAFIATGTARAADSWGTPVTLTHLSGPGFAGMAANPNVLILADGFVAGERAAAERLARQTVHQLCNRFLIRPFDLLKNRMNYFFAWVPSREAGVSTLPEVERLNVAGPLADAEEQDTNVAPADVPTAFHIAAPPTPANNDRYLINERDTAFHSCRGHRPTAQTNRVIRSFRLNDLRLGDSDFNAFLSSLEDRAGNVVGDVWESGGKDETSIVILSRTERSGGSNGFRSPTGRLIVMGLDQADEHQIRDNAAGFGKDLVPDPIPARASIEIWARAAHELGHSFRLDDEYGGGGTLPASREADVLARGNLQARSHLLTGANLDADKVKWRWSRLTKAGITATVANAVGGNFRVGLRAGHVTPFRVGDVVRFRTRDLIPAAVASDRFLVVAKAAPELELEPLTANPFVPANFPAGSLVISPRRAADPDAPNRVFGDDLEMMHADTRARINTTRNPLNANDGDPLNRACAGPWPTPTGSTNWPDTDADARPNPPSPPRYSSWVVGLYENGDTFNCGVYRPTGVCMMRSKYYDDALGHHQAYQFCPVCRYVMVDIIDPTVHGRIDADYEPRYPT